MRRLLGFSFARRVSASLSALIRDRRGVGGVEFAIVAPLLIMLYIGSFEISLGFTVARKVARASSAVSDIVSQQTDVNKTLLDNMKNVALSIMAPYNSTGYTLKITGIQVTGTTSGKVVWSRDQNGATPYAVNSIATVPAELDAVNAFVVRTELVVPHDLLLFAPGLENSTLKTIDLSKTSYYRQRFGETIKCTDC
ncbi:TadE/TadG family type IV pilus assembly protein [Sinorhizobium psoraleae]|uniref:Pilus assembly protein n=1 Tax=Sinorhizobium psoraleae TaxID=520838 RepID=A0ABT4KFX6_9HYPH|nr:TadE/TadG family type IV pilus assembly protein [Sinorhizobium psoraleae]MCZ4090851.1 pilus assembly protein [Sinorhizobium psoraleae]